LDTTVRIPVSYVGLPEPGKKPPRNLRSKIKIEQHSLSINNDSVLSMIKPVDENLTTYQQTPIQNTDKIHMTQYQAPNIQLPQTMTMPYTNLPSTPNDERVKVQPVTCISLNSKPRKYNEADRKKSLERYIQKRQKRDWKRKPRYKIRHEFAVQRRRIRGKFANNQDKIIKNEEVEIEHQKQSELPKIIQKPAEQINTYNIIKSELFSESFSRLLVRPNFTETLPVINQPIFAFTRKLSNFEFKG